MFIFGNIRIDDGTVYQDRLVPVHDKLESLSDLEEKKQVIDDYVDLLETLWSHGIGDTVYNFTLNNGYDDQGRMVQLDFGEIVFDKKKVLEAIEENRWESKRSLNKDISGALRKYALDKMEEEFTEEKVEKLWRENC